MVERSGAGDPARTLALLWRDQTATTSPRGPRPGLTVDQVITTAIDLADNEGLAAVTMRRLAHTLGVAPMSLYTYVPGKAELLDLMLDTIHADMPRVPMPDRPWRDRVTALARDNQDLYERHPWAVNVATGRPPLGPGTMAKYEHELTAFADLGLDDVEMDAALTFVLGFVLTAARAAIDAAATQQDSAMTDEQWWTANEPFLAQAMDPTKFPTASRVGTAAGAAYQGAYSPGHAYDFGLQRVLDGLAALIEHH